MAAVDVIVNNLVSLWSKPTVRRYFPWVFLLISVVGSALKSLELVPQTYFSSSKNALNVYFVKVSWGWTLVLLTLFLLFSYSLNRSVSFLGQRLLSLVVATVIWYGCTEAFFYIEDITGLCYETGTLDVKDFTSKSTCRHAGFNWDGYDISGHSFILSYSALFIMEEIAPMASMMKANMSALHRMLLNLLYVALNLIIIIWLWMFTCTSVYFHDQTQKWLGTICGLLPWYLTYGVWYRKPYSPKLPTQCDPKQEKDF